ALLGGIERGNHLAPAGFWGGVSDQGEACMRVGQSAAANDVAGTTLTRRDNTGNQGERDNRPPAQCAADVVKHWWPSSAGLWISVPFLRKGAENFSRIHEPQTRPHTGSGVSDNSAQIHSTPKLRLLCAWREA